MRGYKVVFVAWDNTLESAYSSKPVIYRLNEWVEPFLGDGPLACFDSMENAYSFCPYDDYFKVYECEYNESEERELYRTWRPWRTPINECPQGTVFASRVKLLEEV